MFFYFYLFDKGPLYRERSLPCTSGNRKWDCSCTVGCVRSLVSQITFLCVRIPRTSISLLSLSFILPSNSECTSILVFLLLPSFHHSNAFLPYLASSLHNTSSFCSQSFSDLTPHPCDLMSLCMKHSRTHNVQRPDPNLY